MTEDGQPPHGSLLYLQQQGYRLTVHCETQPPPGEIPCRHYGDPPWDALIAKFGPDLLDLSRAAARKLGLTRAGVGQVKACPI